MLKAYNFQMTNLYLGSDLTPSKPCSLLPLLSLQQGHLPPPAEIPGHTAPCRSLLCPTKLVQKSDKPDRLGGRTPLLSLPPSAAQREEQRLRVHGDRAGEQLHSLPECPARGMVHGLHEAGSAPPGFSQPPEPTRGSLHQAPLPGPAALPQPRGEAEAVRVRGLSPHAPDQAHSEAAAPDVVGDTGGSCPSPAFPSPSLPNPKTGLGWREGNQSPQGGPGRPTSVRASSRKGAGLPQTRAGASGQSPQTLH